ncbi:MAG: replicative DNA helicase [Holosporales bacterium]|jgi:replicative DNA helicase|nr:replicative DNA helicase [Holosporales bacterium]
MQILASNVPEAVDEAGFTPSNLEAEQALLGVLMLDNGLFEKVSDYLCPYHFSNSAHALIFSSISSLVERGDTADPITLKKYLEKTAEIEQIGGAGYLVDLTTAVVSLHGAADYGRTIYDLYLRRQLISFGNEVVDEARKFDIDANAAAQIEVAEQKLFELADKGQLDGGFVKFSSALNQAVSSAEAAYKSDSKITGVTSGFIELDKRLGGLHKSDLIIIAGRPSMGKTALATNIAYNAAKAQMLVKTGGGTVAFFSLEMSSEQLATRIIAQECNIASDRIRRGEIKSTDFKRFTEVVREIGQIPLFIDDTPALTISALRSRARRLKRQQGLSLIVIDYLQLLHVPGASKLDNRVQEISYISRMLKAIAKELDVPVIALSQLSRAVEQRDEKRPQLADLRESGSIEQDADIVLFIYREEYYESRKEPAQGTEKHEQWQNKLSKIYNTAEIIVAKQRHGPIGTIKLFFDGKVTKFDNLSEKAQS